MSCFLGAVLTAAIALATRLRVLPFLRDDMIFSGGKLTPTDPWAAAAAQGFWCVSAAFVLFGIVGLLILSEEDRRYIAQLSAGKRFLIWPWVKR